MSEGDIRWKVECLYQNKQFYKTSHMFIGYSYYSYIVPPDQKSVEPSI
jgi:hypothetical protein